MRLNFTEKATLISTTPRVDVESFGAAGAVGGAEAVVFGVAPSPRGAFLFFPAEEVEVSFISSRSLASAARWVAARRSDFLARTPQKSRYGTLASGLVYLVCNVFVLYKRCSGVGAVIFRIVSFVLNICSI